MKKSSMGFAFGIAAAILIPTMSVSANDGGQSLESRFQQMAEMESGVQNVKKDAYGRITTLMVVGKGKVSRAFSKQRAKQVAGKEAVREARNAFAQWLNTSVSWSETASGEVVLKEKGGAEGDTGAAVSAQEGVATEATAEQSKAFSQAALSGLRQIWGGYDKDGMRVVIMGWSMADCKGIVKVSRTMGKAARESVNQAKAVEGARLQDPNAAYNREEARDQAAAVPPPPPAPVAAPPAPQSTGYGNNVAPARTSGSSSDAADFF